MKLSTLTLQKLKDMVPRQLTGRYSVEDFPASIFNEISAHLEKYADTNYMTDEMIIPQENGITRYRLDDRVRQPRGLYEIPKDGTLNASRHVVVAGNAHQSIPSLHPDKSNPIRFDQFGNDLVINHSPAVSFSIHTDSRNIVDSTGSTTKKLFDVDASGPLDEDENLRGKGIIVTHDNGDVDHLIIAENNSTENSLRVNGEMSVAPNDNTVYSIYNDFWILEFTIYLPTVSALGDSLNIPKDFEQVYRWGMFWYYYAQEGENKVEIDRYQNLFEQEKSRFCSDQNRFRSDNFITVPRDVPRLFPPIRVG